MEVTLFDDRVLLVFDGLKDRYGKIILPNAHSERTRKATVKIVGPDVKNYAPGDRVVMSWYTGITLHLDGETLFGEDIDEERYRIVREGEILMKITAE